jgi:cell wall-associated NlpC family hydrolase
MNSKLAYLSAFLLMIVFLFYAGPLLRGEDENSETVIGTKRPTYVKGEERTTDTDAQENRGQAQQGDEAAGQGASSGVKDLKDQEEQKPPDIDSDYLKEVPPDYNLKLPPPTQQELQGLMAAAALNSDSSIGLRLLAASYHYLGVPYRLGGDGVHTTDCSMFTRMSAIRAGLEPQSFRRGAGIQYGYSLKKQFNMRLISTGTNLKGLMPGDFVFFNWRNEFSRVRPYGIGHVGLYIGPTRGTAIYTIEAGNPVHKGWRNTKYLVGFGRIVKAP